MKHITILTSLLLLSAGIARADEYPVGKTYFKPGKGLTVESADGEFKLSTRVRGQLRYEAHLSDGDPVEHSVRIRRARLVFDGNFFGKDNTFKMELAVAPNDLGMTAAEEGSDEPIREKNFRVSRSPLLDLYFQFKQLRDLNVRAGQYKIPFSRQRVISSGDLMFVDRSIVNSEFTLDRDLGFDFRSKDLFGLDGKLRYYAGLYTGEGHSSFNNHPVSTAAHGFGLNALLRLEYLPLGPFEDYKESTLKQPTTPGLALGGSIAHVGKAAGVKGVLGRSPEDGGTTDMVVAEADAIFKYRGFSAQTEFMHRKGERNNDGEGTIEAARNGWGLTGQAGYLLPCGFEVAARHSAIRGRGATSLSDSNETGGALSYYLAGHPYKIQADYLRKYSEDITDGSHQVRVQLQAGL